MPRALLSLTDKSGAADFAHGLADLGFELISTGGTAKALREAGLAVRDVSDVTGFPEMMDGRVKTLHPMVHGGLLGDRRNPGHVAAMAEAGITGIDVLCVNLYAFEQTVSGPHEFEAAVESIDIGGPAMVRSAAKNHASVLVVVDPADYGAVLEALSGEVPDSLRISLAAKAFRHTAYYDSMISRYMTERAGGSEWPEKLTLGCRWDGMPLRYGENPHQKGARYIDPLNAQSALTLIGSQEKGVSYINWLDAQGAWDLVCELPKGACAIIKHANPCGAALGANLGDSYRLAKASDPVSSFGGIVGFNQVVDEAAVAAMTEKGNFLEVIVSAGWESEDLIERFRAHTQWAANCRLLVGDPARPYRGRSFRTMGGGVLVQDVDVDPGEADWKVVTDRQPTSEEWEALRFQWRIIRHVSSNAIVIGSATRLLGVGAGQMNRVQSVRLALAQAGESANGAALASDAFFPFPDSLITAAEAGVRAFIQPGGSKKDDEAIAAANERGLTMVFTGVRHFKH
ncbi:MAG: bifunctional phosphoribosylaminoimidazolecarboxamide formyltransferase/IMP cyclohydrolase [Armatimonadetes bacterium]|nr:bifunctional phosphoribosylaminoimidazolecarboxamide formyltransferase/IMP cyclohydrolase [Armatimonadota bacterium]